MSANLIDCPAQVKYLLSCGVNRVQLCEEVMSSCVYLAQCEGEPGITDKHTSLTNERTTFSSHLCSGVTLFPWQLYKITFMCYYICIYLSATTSLTSIIIVELPYQSPSFTSYLRSFRLKATPHSPYSFTSEMAPLKSEDYGTDPLLQAQMGLFNSNPASLGMSAKRRRREGHPNPDSVTKSAKSKKTANMEGSSKNGNYFTCCHHRDK